MIVQPPAPLKPVEIIFPFVIEYTILPSGAAISIPEWLDEAPWVGAFLFPKLEVMVWKPGIGQKKSSLVKK